MMLPHVIRFNAADEAARLGYAQLASAPEIACVSDGLEPAVEALVAEIEAFLNSAKMPARLRDCGVESSALATLAAEAVKQWTATFNPRPISEADFLALYEAAF
jgi:alcohol dehydrogenase